MPSCRQCRRERRTLVRESSRSGSASRWTGEDARPPSSPRRPASFRAGTPDRQHQHGEKNYQQAKRSCPNVGRMLRQNGKTPVHEFNVYPIDQQRGLPQLYQRTESPLTRAPAAPRISHSQNRQQQPHPNQKEIRTGMPEVIDRIKLLKSRIHPPRQIDQNHSGRTGYRERRSFTLARPITEEEETDGQTGKSESRPGKDGEKPRLRLAQIVHAVDVRFDWPGQPVRAPRGPEQRR